MMSNNFASIDPYEFEVIVATLFQDMGYDVKVTKKGNDFGVDVIATSESEKVAIQVKKWAKGNNVGNRDVQRLLGAMQLSTIKATKSILITTSDFTRQARKQAVDTPIEL